MLREVGAGIIDENMLKKFRNPYNPANYLGDILEKIEKISVAREGVARMAKFLKDMERISEGKSVVAGETNIKGLAQIDAAGKASREFTVDYGAVPQAYKRALRGVLTPFLSFYDYNARNWFKYAVKHPKELAVKIGIPSAAIWTWNNTGSRKQIEENLGFWKYLPHIIPGWKKGDKDIIVAIQTPTEMAGSWFGLDRIPAKITDIRAGKITLKEAALEQLKDTGLGAPRQVARLLNPMIQAIYGMASNKDPYTGKPIVPGEYQGTKYEAKYKAEFILGKLLTPYGQYLRLQGDIELTPELGSLAAWMFKGPLDVIRAVGIRKTDLEVNRMVEVYGERGELTNVVKNKLAILKTEYIKANTMDKEESAKHLQETFKKVMAMEGPMPTTEQIFNRFGSENTQIEILINLIQRTKDKETRKRMEEFLKTLRRMKYFESIIKHSQKAIRPEIIKELGK